MVYLKLDLTRELVVLVSYEVQICIYSSVDSRLLFTMDFKGFFTMDFLQNSLNIIPEKLVYLKLDLMRELVVVPWFSELSLRLAEYVLTLTGILHYEKKLIWSL